MFRAGPKPFPLAHFFFFSAIPLATSQVIADEACDKYAVDIAGFATCADGKLTRAKDQPATAWVSAPLVSGAAARPSWVGARESSSETIDMDMASFADAWMNGKSVRPRHGTYELTLAPLCSATLGEKARAAPPARSVMAPRCPLVGRWFEVR